MEERFSLLCPMYDQTSKFQLFVPNFKLNQMKFKENLQNVHVVLLCDLVLREKIPNLQFGNLTKKNIRKDAITI
jgi:hypothetical protein